MPTLTLTAHDRNRRIKNIIKLILRGGAKDRAEIMQILIAHGATQQEATQAITELKNDGVVNEA